MENLEVLEILDVWLQAKCMKERDRIRNKTHCWAGHSVTPVGNDFCLRYITGKNIWVNLYITPIKFT